jgi:RNA polymerase sigma factor (sigma-70 family)
MTTFDEDLHLDEVSTGELVRRAHDGDRYAWNCLVDRHVSLIWSIARQFRLDDADAADVTQTTWLRLLENLDRLTDPERVASWLATTARRECLRTLARRKRVVVTDDLLLDRQDPGVPDVSSRLVAEETRSEVRAALQSLPPRWRGLLELLSVDPPMSYADIAATLDIPIGSIGPTRARSLARLRVLLAE